MAEAVGGGGGRRWWWWRGRWWAAAAAVVVVAALMPHNTAGNIDLYMTSEETKRVLGLPAELYYVREGVINKYALEFIVPVPANFTYIYFTWRSLIKRPVGGLAMQYMAHVEYDNGEAMALPQLNISNKGLVPVRPDTFSFHLPFDQRERKQHHVDQSKECVLVRIRNMNIKGTLMNPV
nr:tyrosine-protein kinase Drl-like [Cherax quadricarinatus]